jgi:hypothetical protein
MWDRLSLPAYVAGWTVSGLVTLVTILVVLVFAI